MALTIVTLENLLNKSDFTEEDIKKLLFSFETISSKEAPGSDDIQHFIHHKAIEFEKSGLSRTTLVMSTYKGTSFLAGYYSIANKSLVIRKKNYQKLSNNFKRRLNGIGYKTEQKNYQIPSILLGQLGKNYNSVAKKADSCTGDELLALASKTIKKVYEIIGGRIVYLECEDNTYLKEFYSRNGYTEIAEFKSTNDLCIFIKDIKKL